MPVRSPHLLGDCPVVPLANPSHWTLTGDDDDDDGDGEDDGDDDDDDDNKCDDDDNDDITIPAQYDGRAQEARGGSHPSSYLCFSKRQNGEIQGELMLMI